MKPFIVLQTDFSLNWPFVCTMKGVIKQIDPSLEIFDGSHTITQFSVLDASQQLNYILPFWKNSIIVSVVDPGVGTARKASIAVLDDGNIVITPDNGTLTHIYSHIQKIYEIKENVRYQGTEKVSVFHGRDIFAYCAGLLASGKYMIEEIADEYSIDEIILLDPVYLRANVTSKDIEGIVSNVSDPFGSIVFNILTDDFNQAGYRIDDMIHIELYKDGKLYFNKDVLYAASFGAVEIGEPVLFNSSSNYISLGLNQGSFKEKYQVQAGINYQIKIHS